MSTNGNDRYGTITFICSECGKSFEVINRKDYQYKVRTGTTKLEKSQKTHYQCSYTCNEHAKLRLGLQGYLSDENFNKYVIAFENSMIAQHKKILHPIKYKIL